MLKITNTIVEKDGDFGTNTYYNVEGTVELAMDSIWDYKGKKTLEVSAIQVYEHTDSEMGQYDVNVMHNGTWDIYTDNGFETAISNLLGVEVQFTEQGMQEDGRASMET